MKREIGQSAATAAASHCLLLVTGTGTRDNAVI